MRFSFSRISAVAFVLACRLAAGADAGTVAVAVVEAAGRFLAAAAAAGDAVNLSRAAALDLTGLVGCGDNISSSPLDDEESSLARLLTAVLPAAWPAAAPPRVPTDGRVPSVRAPPAMDDRPLNVLVGAPEVPEATLLEVDEGLDVRDAGSDGGPIDVRVAPVAAAGRVTLAPIETALPATLDGVPVRVLAPLVGAVASCFVGDFVGD